METEGKKIRVAMYCWMGANTDSRQEPGIQKMWRISQGNPPVGFSPFTKFFTIEYRL